MRELELLAPAANKEIAKEAILHGADAVYMGANTHGARKNAANSIEDIKEVVTFAHQFRARIYVTVNTLVYENEIHKVEQLIRDLYKIGVDAIIVQDMGVLRMDLPPIALHASTQCDTRDVEKAVFLEKAGFSQIVLARELTCNEISEICRNVSVPVECFVHGALCVSYSGRCRASYVETGRSANRGECSQMCRMKYTLYDADGTCIIRNKHLLSLKDFNLSENIEDLIEAGVSSFKIEGRLKDAAYVKNVVAYYRRKIDAVIAENPTKYRRSSYGQSIINFTPQLDKSFNRGFTDYFFNNRKNGGMASLLTPKSMGERIHDTSQINNGDGISFVNDKGEFEGVRINKVVNGKLVGATQFHLPPNAEIRRTFDNEWQNRLAKATASRAIRVDIEINDKFVSARDERGVEVTVPLDVDKFKAENPMHPEKIFGKLGNTIYQLDNFVNNLSSDIFIQASQLNNIKRLLVSALDKANLDTYRFDYRRNEDRDVPFMLKEIDAEGNVSNSLAKQFYEDHGARVNELAIETSGNKEADQVVMRTRYCIRRELGMCKKNNQGASPKEKLREPFIIESDVNRFKVEFDCSKCEMRILNMEPQKSTPGKVNRRSRSFR